MLKTWEGIKSIININTTKKKSINCLNVNNTEETDHFLLSSSFNKFFTTIAKKIESNIVHTPKNYTDYLTNPSEKTFFLTPTSPDEVEDIINTLNLRKSIGPNSIPTKLLKKYSKTISIPISKLINQSFVTRIFPEPLKLANVIPVFKKADPLQCTNYRPISLTSNIGKILEKLVNTRLYCFLDQNEILYNNQYGFRNNHSATHALIDITEKIRNALDSKYYACGVFIDLEKAFDTVNHTILLDKLKYYGVRGITNTWFKSFLQHRYQYTNIKECSSEKLLITHGVPQGSVLGPLLFLLYINDLHKAMMHCSVYHFADDANLLLIDKSLKRINKHINHDLKYLFQWIRSNRLSLNGGKTKIIIFRNRFQQINKKLNFRVSGEKINLTSSVKYLGVYLTPTLTWSTYLLELIPKLNRAVGLLSKIRHYTPKPLLRTIYYSLFNSHLIYACQTWGQSKTELFKKIQKLQDKAVRIINFLPNTAPVSEIYKTTKILKLSDYISLQNALLVKNCFQKQLPRPLLNFFRKTTEQHNHSTRSASKNFAFVGEANSKSYGIDSIRYQAVIIWNKLQNNITSDLTELSRMKVKSTVIEHFLKSY